MFNGFKMRLIIINKLHLVGAVDEGDISGEGVTFD